MLPLLSPDRLVADFQSKLSTQDYSKKPAIEGVGLIDLRLMLDDGGSFSELVRLDEKGCLEAIPSFKVRQSSYSELLPGSIKAFHLHFNQDDVWFVPPSQRLLVGLIDARQDSPSCGVSQRLVLGGGRAQLLHIPRGVGHGGANIWSQSSSILYFVNQQFDMGKPDEQRLPWDILGKEFWEIAKG